MAGRPRKTKSSASTNELLHSLLFVGSVLKDQGSPNETHILLSNNWAVAFNGVVASGCPIPSNIYAAPNYALLQAALVKCGEDYSIALDGDRIVVKSGKFKAIVPCFDPAQLTISGIDPNVAAINDEFKVALAATGALTSDTGQTIHSASILMNGQSLISTENGVLLFEYWHGNDLPTNIAVPKALVAPLTKTTKRLTGFGCSASSVTFYFEDSSWIKSQLFSEQWPDVGRILNVEPRLFELPKELWNGMDAVSPHSVDNLVYFGTDILHSHASDLHGASYEVKGLPKGPVFNIKQLMFIKDYAKQIDFFCHSGRGVMTYFVGDKCRGCIAGRMQQE